MKTQRPMRALVLAAAASLVAIAGHAEAQNWPTRPVTMVVPFTAGTTSDVVARVLAQKMPNPKSGTVTPNIGNAIRDIKAGKVEYRLDKTAIVHTLVGKASFDESQIADNINTLIDAIVRAKPSAAKGKYLKKVAMTTSMGPAILVDPSKTRGLSEELEPATA